MAALLRKPGHGCFAVRVSEVSQMSGPCLGAVSATGADMQPEIQQVLNGFPLELPAGLPPDRWVRQTIDLEPSSRPVHRLMYCLSLSERTELDVTPKLCFRKVFLNPRLPPFGLPIFFVAKEYSFLHIVIDYRALNRLTIRNRMPLSRIDDLFDRVQGSAVVTSLDSTSGYHQIRISEEDRFKSAFRPPLAAVTFEF